MEARAIARQLDVSISVFRGQDFNNLWPLVMGDRRRAAKTVGMSNIWRGSVAAKRSSGKQARPERQAGTRRICEFHEMLSNRFS